MPWEIYLQAFYYPPPASVYPSPGTSIAPQPQVPGRPRLLHHHHPRPQLHTHTHTPQPWAEVSITPLAPCFPTRSPTHCCVLASRAATPSGRDCSSCFTSSFADCAVDKRALCTVPSDATTHSVKKSSSGPCQFSSVRFGSGSVQFKMVSMVVM